MVARVMKNQETFDSVWRRMLACLPPAGTAFVVFLPRYDWVVLRPQLLRPSPSGGARMRIIVRRAPPVGAFLPAAELLPSSSGQIQTVRLDLYPADLRPGRVVYRKVEEAGQGCAFICDIDPKP